MPTDDQPTGRLPGARTPAGWFPERPESGYERWWDGTHWTKYRRPITSPTGPGPPPPFRPTRAGGLGTTAKVLVGVAILLGVLWFTGALDKPLSDVGLNKNDCIQNALGATFCGGGAKNYCRDIADGRGPACEQILGVDEARRVRRAADRKLQSDITRSTTPHPRIADVPVGQTGTDDGLRIRVIRLQRQDSIITGGYSPAITPGRSRQLLEADVTIKNETSKSVDPLCGGASGFVLLDDQGNQFDAMTRSIEIPGNQGICADGIQPGTFQRYSLAYRLPASATVGGLLAWNDDADADPGGDRTRLRFLAQQ